VKAEAEAASAVEAQGDAIPAADPEDGVSMETNPEAEAEEPVSTSVQSLATSHIAPTLFRPNRFYRPYPYIYSLQKPIVGASDTANESPRTI
jgi:hypothetical protein